MKVNTPLSTTETPLIQEGDILTNRGQAFVYGTYDDIQTLTPLSGKNGHSYESEILCPADEWIKDCFGATSLAEGMNWFPSSSYELCIDKID